MYENGLGVDVDLNQARLFYTNAIQQDGLFSDIYTAHLANKARQKLNLIEVGKYNLQPITSYRRWSSSTIASIIDRLLLLHSQPITN